MSSKEKNGANFINKYWKLGALVVGVISAWVLLRVAVDANTANIEKLETRAGDTEKVLQEINVNLAEIKTTLKFIEQQVEKK